MRYCLAVLIIVLLTGNGVAQTVTGKGQSIILGAGAFTCGKFAQQYKVDPVGTETFYTSWFLGFLIGINTMTNTVGFPQRDYSALSIEGAQIYEKLLQRSSARPVFTGSDSVC
jgi:hypothetical protein